jgi:hypothetical protein
MRRQWRWIAGVAVAAILGLAIVGELAQSSDSPSDTAPAAPTANLDITQSERPPLVFTYFFYWYDAETMQHLEPQSGLPVHLPAEPAPSWRSVEWFRKQLLDMREAGIDIVLPVYWGDTEQWSVDGLLNLARAKDEIEAEGGTAPGIGLFFDTTILDGRDLTEDAGKAYFYEQIRHFYDRIPENQWARVDGRPVIWLYFAFFASAFDQTSFDYIYDSFDRDYGVRPYIVRELTWDFAVDNDGGRNVDETKPIATDANYKWGAALDGYSPLGSVAAAGPGFDEREIPGRGNAYRPRDDRAWFFQNFGKAIDSEKRMVVIETWNEIHEASGIGETVEYGRQYIELTARLVEEFKNRRQSAP